MGQVRFPSLYQINTRIMLEELSRQLGRPATLTDVPDETLDGIAALGFDWVWLLGVWQTGPAGRAVSLNHPQWRPAFQSILPDFSDADVCGSPFAIQRYEVHTEFGGTAAMFYFRDRLRQRGLHLMLDFVPNHSAIDHPWVATHPEFYIQGNEADLARAPQNYCRVPSPNGPVILAHGRDPYFPGWPDTLQLNYRHPALRAAMIQELTKIADRCDGVRCDMAMLVLPDIFQRTWGNAALPRDGAPPVDTQFWPEAIDVVRRRRPEFKFMAEVYWDLEWTLQQQGFDYTYDKRLYDRLHARDVESVRGHLWADAEFQRRSVRFLENHDEPRAAGAFPTPVHKAAAVVAFLVPGMRFFHEGQLEGRRTHASMHLRRRPPEPVNAEMREFYRQLLNCLKRPDVRVGRWRLLEVRPAWEENRTFERFLAYSWENDAGQRLLVAVNYGPSQAQCFVRLPWADLSGKQLLLRDLMGTARYERDGDDLTRRGLFLDLPEWHYHVFEARPSEKTNLPPNS